jgi:hypothetical protein
MDTVHEDLRTFLIISRSFLLRMKIFFRKVVEKIKTHILCSIAFFYGAIYKIMWKI